MQLPIDIVQLIDETTGIDNARKTEISVSVYIDEHAPSDLVAHVRNAFASTSSTLRMTLSYLDRSFRPEPLVDMAVIVAGPSRGIGAAASAIRAVGVPVAVITTMPATVGRLAQDYGHPIADGDIIAPHEGDSNEGDEPYELDDDMAAALDERMARWILSVCEEKKLAFAIAFPFMRQPLAVEAVRATSAQNAGIGLVSFIPGSDLPIMTLNQAKMVLQIAAAYNQNTSIDRIKEIAGVIGGAYVCRTIARELVEFVPVLGILVRPGIAYGGTSGMGYAIINYFEGGQDAAGVANVVTRATKAASGLVSDICENPKEVALNACEQVGHAAFSVGEKVGNFAKTAVGLIAENAPKVKDAAVDVINSLADDK